MMNELESKLEKLTRLTKAFEQADDAYKRSCLSNELLCTLENTTLSARRYFSPFLKPEKRSCEAHILPYHVEEHCAVEVTRDGWTHIRLNTLLQSNRQRVTGYIESTLLQMLHDHRAAGGTLPWYDRAFVIITEHTDRRYTGRTFDPDDKEWKLSLIHI